MKRCREMSRRCCWGGEFGVRNCWREVDWTVDSGEEAKVVVEDMRKYKVNKISSSLRTLMDRVSRQNRSRGPQTEAYL